MNEEKHRVRGRQDAPKSKRYKEQQKRSKTQAEMKRMRSSTSSTYEIGKARWKKRDYLLIWAITPSKKIIEVS